MGKTQFRIGSGFDVHGFEQGRALVIGGVHIPHDKGLAGHSDADVLLHALCDAVLGAIGQGDIGEHFPDTDPQYKGVSSLVLLKACAAKLLQFGYEASNIDCTVFAQAPKLSPFKKEMEKNIADVFHIRLDQVNVKATTTEQLGFIGRKEGITAHSTILIQSI